MEERKIDITKTKRKIESLIKESVHASLNDRLDIQEQISGYTVYLAEEENQCFVRFKRAYTARRTAEARSSTKATKARQKRRNRPLTSAEKTGMKKRRRKSNMKT